VRGRRPHREAHTLVNGVGAQLVTDRRQAAAPLAPSSTAIL
jgi:hypothetical protein